MEPRTGQQNGATPAPEEGSRLDELQQKLYSRNPGTAFDRKVHTLSPEKRSAVPAEWKSAVPPVGLGVTVAPMVTPPKKNENSAVTKFFIASLLFFISAAGIAVYVFYGGGNVVSGNNIDIKVAAPVSIEGGKELVMKVTVVNNNNVDLEGALLLADFPEGTHASVDSTTSLTRYQADLGVIPARGTVNKEVRAVLFGGEGTQAQIVFGVEYNIKGSNAQFKKEKPYDVTISSSPLNITVDALKETTSKQPVTMTITVRSNATSVLKNVLLVGQYPAGFTFSNSSPSPAFDTNVWNLGDMPPQSEKKIILSGIIEGQDGEDRIFRFSGGLQSPENERQVQVAFVTSLQKITVKKPFLGLVLAVNGDTADTVAVPADRSLRAEVSWTNNLPTRITDGTIKVKLAGNFDKTSVSVDSGFYRSIDNTIVWTKEDLPQLGIMNPGDTGTVRFTLSPLPSAQLPSGASFTIGASASAKRISETNVPQDVTSGVDRTVKIATDASLAGRVVYYTGPITNTGPLPPKADQETSYTVIWTITNSLNTITGGRVVSSLPSYVRWGGVVSPTTEKISYKDGQIVWEVGDIPAAKGGKSTPREIAFQVVIRPSISQVNSSPVIVGESTFTGTDQFAGSKLQASKSALTTRLSTDPSAKPGDDQVVQ